MLKILNGPAIWTFYMAFYIVAVSIVIISGESYLSFTIGVRLFKFEFIFGVNDHKEWILHENKEKQEG